MEKRNVISRSEKQVDSRFCDGLVEDAADIFGKKGTEKPKTYDSTLDLGKKPEKFR